MEYLYLLISSFVSATLLPFGSEALLLYDLTLGLNVVVLFVSATFGNSLGSVVNYWLGLKGENYLESKKIIKKQSIQKAQKYFDKYGAYSLLLSWVPIIGDPITFVAGLSKYNFKKFLLLVVFTKGMRYLFLIITYYLYI
ncbi:MAG TPA: DedA family protein [Arcobacter sp.]|nr:DedA family protein [Arcobacter sp.]